MEAREHMSIELPSLWGNLNWEDVGVLVTLVRNTQLTSIKNKYCESRLVRYDICQVS